MLLNKMIVNRGEMARFHHLEMIVLLALSEFILHEHLNECQH